MYFASLHRVPRSVAHCVHFPGVRNGRLPCFRRIATVPVENLDGSSRDSEAAEGWLYVDSVFPIQLGRLDLRRYIGFIREENLLANLMCELIATVPVENLDGSSRDSEAAEGWLYVDSVFPIQLGRLDLRRYIGFIREENLLANLKVRLSALESYGLEIVSLEPVHKDGGVFVKFRYNVEGRGSTLGAIENDLRQHIEKRGGGLPSWSALPRGNIWLVKGHPWREDMDRFPSPLVNALFEGSDIDEEYLYQVFRPYGRIRNISPPTPVPSSTLRSSVVAFQQLRSATIARNVVHGVDLSTGRTVTRLRTAYVQPLAAHVIRDWISAHPRIVLPVVVFLLGTLTYTIFDPVRAFMVQGKISEWFNFRGTSFYKWLRTNALDHFSFHTPANDLSAEAVWKERKDAKSALGSYLSDIPTTITFMHGPQGSGKSRMLEAMLKQTGRQALVIDCQELSKASSDSYLVTTLADQTGYWPVFSFMNTLSNVIDLASVGLIGQKSGFSSSLPEQLQKILDVVTTGLQGVSSSHRSALKRKMERQRRVEEQDEADAEHREQIRRGVWHDGRMDCVAGNGVMSELGFGVEKMSEADMDLPTAGDIEREARLEAEEGAMAKEMRKQQMSEEDSRIVGLLPIVVIKNYAAKTVNPSPHYHEVLDILAKWAARIAENKIAHVIVLSDNRENARRLARALPSKPINFVALYDADPTSALLFVKQKLQDSAVELELTNEQVEQVERLGGRASDLESLIHKIRGGQRVDEAVEDIINKCVGELRKNAFGVDIEDSNHLQWSREQAWAIIKQLSSRGEIPYYEVLSDFPFKGDEAPLRNMDHAEVISIVTNNGCPSTIRPGKPVYRYAFQRLVEDSIFRASQDIAFNEKLIASAESTVKSCEQELAMLRGIGIDSAHWWGGKTGPSSRAGYLFDKMLAAEAKLEVAEKQNTELKKVLAKGG